ncbi:MAG: ATP-binding protein [Chthoniobacter sp.]
MNIDIRTEMGNVPTVPGNESELREMLVNLIFNSIDAIPKRGTITIETELQGRWLVITVKDDGIGMSEEVKARCLEPFYSTKDDEGTGLGLGSVYGIVRRHEGEIDIQTEARAGDFDLCVAPAGQARQAAGSAQARRDAQCHVADSGGGGRAAGARGHLRLPRRGQAQRGDGGERTGRPGEIQGRHLRRRPDRSPPCRR